MLFDEATLKQIYNEVSCHVLQNNADVVGKLCEERGCSQNEIEEWAIDRAGWISELLIEGAFAQASRPDSPLEVLKVFEEFSAQNVPEEANGPSNKNMEEFYAVTTEALLGNVSKRVRAMIP